MPVNARTFVKPALFQRGIGTDTHQVLAAIVQILRDVIHLRGIAAGLMPQVKTVHPNTGIAEYPVKLQPDMLAQIILWHCKSLSIPAHARLGVFIAHRLVAVAVTGFGGERQIDHPVVGQVDRLPRRSVELLGIRPGVMDRRRLRQIIKILGSTPEILLRRRRIAKGKLPIVVKKDALALRLGRNRQCHAQHRCNNQNPMFIHTFVLMILVNKKRIRPMGCTKAGKCETRPKHAILSYSKQRNKSY